MRSFQVLVQAVVVSLLPYSALGLGVQPNQIKNLISFGDSYTDVVQVADGGVSWPVYAAGYGGFNLSSFARYGATCSNNLTFAPFPSVFESQLPSYFAQRANGTLKLDEDKTIYTLWIGTNDVGMNALLTGDGAPGVSVVNTTTCAVNWVKTLYDAGARNFIFQNMIPLELTVLYSRETYFNRDWDMQRNSTEWNIVMSELTKAANAISKLLLQQLVPTLQGAHVGMFDSHSLFQDMYNHPANYLNGTAPLNVTGSSRSCVLAENQDTTEQGNCTIATGTAMDSFLWYDELHPSEQADRIVAREITQAIQGQANRWTTWFS